ncbi:hypothetical protein MKX46_02600 [Paenibacillus sp. FSL P4-0113]|uniref:hypothetical protein n=1 Tax=Paenibacillus sp. FSL P4-0113 TaxID=2921630 RepID=UPI0030F8ED01
MSPLRINLDTRNIPQFHTRSGFQAIDNARIRLRIPSYAVPVRHTPSRSIEWRPAENDALWHAFPGPVRIWSMPQSMVVPEGMDDGAVKPELIVKSVSKNEQGGTEETIAYGFNNDTNLPLRWKSGMLLRLRIKQSVELLAEAGSAPWWQGKIHSFLGVRESDIVLLERLLKLGREALNGADLHARLLYRSGTDDTLQAVKGSPVLFVLQENLSSDTNPASALVLSGETETGLVGDMHLFISKLWEGSITRAGGYRLFAGNGEDAQGKLPNELFDDKGEAELQLLLVGSDSKAHSYLNCLITGGLTAASPGRSMYAEWEREELPIEQLDENSSFADMMDRYLGDWNEFAEAHAEQPLNVGETLMIEGSIELIRPEVLDTVEKIVMQYGNSFSAEELKKLNKHIPDWTKVAGGTYFYIPRTTHEVKKEAEIRNLKGIAKLYNVSVTSLIWSNQEKLLTMFANSKEIRLRTGPIHRLPALPEGAIELIAERDASANDAKPDDEEDLEELFHLLSYRILCNDRFEAHVPALPIGPTETANHQALPGQADGANASAPQAPLHYTKAIPYVRFLKQEKMTEPQGFPAYRGIGSVLQMKYDWMDVFGNRLVRDSEKQEGLRNLLPPVTIGFTDELLGPQQWPTIVSDYEIVTEKGQPMIRVRFTRDISYLKSAPTDETKKQTEAQAERLYRAAGQLEHQLKGIETVDCLIRTSLMPLTFSEPILLTAADRNNLIAFLKETAELQTAWANGSVNSLSANLLSEDKPLLLDLRIDLEQITEQDVFELTVSLEFVRKRYAVDPEFRFTSAFWRQAANILPARSLNALSNGPDGVDPTLSLRNFASQLEAALNIKEGPRYRTAVGLDRRKWIERAVDVAIWLVRASAPDNIDGDGIQFSIPEHAGKSQEPIIYAPSPLINADTLLPYKQQYNASGKVTGDQPNLNVSTLDMERQARFFLDTFEQILASEAMAAFELLRPEPDSKRYSEQLMECKEQLAKTISAQLIKVYDAIKEDDSSSEDKELLDSAREVYKQKLLHSLSKTYLLDAVAQFRVYLSGITNKSSNGQEDKPRLYGTIRTAEPLPAGLTLPPCKIDIASKGVADSYSLLNISFVGTREDPAAITPKPYVQVDGYYNPTHIEHQIEQLPEIPEFKASSWLYFILPDSQQLDLTFLDRQLGSFQVPLALRSYPEIPVLSGQALHDPETDQSVHGRPLEEHLKWDYEFTYSRTRHLPQDRVRVEVVFRENTRGHLESGEDLQHLCGALKDYHDYYPALIEKVKTATNVGSMASEEAKTVINDAAHALIDIVKFIASNWQGWENFKSGLQVTSSDLKPKPTSSVRHDYQFYIEEAEREDGVWGLRLTETSPNPSSEAPLVEIAGYQCIPADNPVFMEGGKLCRYDFTYTDANGAPLRAEAGLTALKRKVKLPGLNILRESSAWTSIAITRNEELVEGKRTAAPFIYRTDKHRFEQAYLPSLRRNYPIAMTDEDPSDPQPLDEQLNRFIDRIFGDVTISNSFGNYYLQAECMYSYRLANQLFSIVVPVLLMPRRSLADRREVVDTIAKQVETFFATRRPETNGGQFHFDLSVLNDQNGTTAPFTLLRLTDVVLELDKVKLNG